MASEDTGRLAGAWHPPRSSLSVEALLVCEGRRFVVRDAAGARLAEAGVASVEVSARVGSVPRRFTFADGSLFETVDNDTADLFLRSAGARPGGFVHWLEQFRPRLVVIVLAVIVLAAGVYRFALPALVEVAIVVTPPVVPQLMSQGTMSTLDRAIFSESTLDPTRQAEIRAGFGEIAARSEAGPEAFALNFRHGGITGPNAFALPDGTIVITDELIELAGGDDDMILGVLAHEIGHVEHEHSLRQLYRAAGLAGLVMLIAGDIGSAMEDILAQGGGLLALSYSRDAEREADRHSVDLMLAAGRDPLAIDRFFARIEPIIGNERTTSLLATHPATAERRQAIADYVAERTAERP
ncbi:M48 family metallopeptidase [Rhizobiaceae bacterium BDR2-2]|uniref:M48 family metallopeptidase n=1 Tax=Ectorhizobium quercum TaxID=2965071 RepID=A0AAE3N1B4_9HYPH|nr:M48 family metallopeptidase [Ectorhizobium quercum]MCX8996167.1 M48 family metallopeptidase [Ectorhizobium quercum]MCX8998794.1 M48 family metallopeptidase [Ectorhizobium quercum]